MKDPPPVLTCELIARAAAGEEVARSDVLQYYLSGPAKIVPLLMTTVVRGFFEAQDVVQDVGQELLDKLGRFQWSEAKLEKQFGKRVTTIAKHRIISHWRKIRRFAEKLDSRPPSSEPQAGRSPSRSAARREAVEKLQQSISRLPAESVTVIRLAHFEHLTDREIAARLGMTEGSIKGLRQRAYRILRRYMGGSSGYSF